MRYEDLKLEGLDMPEELRDNLNGLFTLCQKYYTYYLQYKKIVEKENTLLKYPRIIYARLFIINICIKFIMILMIH